MNGPVIASAGLDSTRTYRYWLKRVWTMQLEPLVVIGLNPSTADEMADDPTIRRCVSFAKREGKGGLVMVNLFAYRTKSPKVLMAAGKDGTDVVGRENDRFLLKATEGRLVLCGWGLNGWYQGRGEIVKNLLLLEGRQLVCFGYTDNGQPLHPLYMRGDRKLEAIHAA